MIILAYGRGGVLVKMDTSGKGTGLKLYGKIDQFFKCELSAKVQRELLKEYFDI